MKSFENVSNNFKFNQNVAAVVFLHANKKNLALPGIILFHIIYLPKY